MQHYYVYNEEHAFNSFLPVRPSLHVAAPFGGVGIRTAVSSLYGNGRCDEIFLPIVRASQERYQANRGITKSTGGITATLDE
jgi:hypothetical protein